MFSRRRVEFLFSRRKVLGSSCSRGGRCWGVLVHSQQVLAEEDGGEFLFTCEREEDVGKFLFTRTTGEEEV